MTTNHIDQLAQWWDSAEDAPASPGDRIIERHVCERDGDTYYTVGVHREGMRGLIGKSGTRILSRAPKPKPAWHGAVAVTARSANAPEDHREPFIRSGATPDVWIGEGGYCFSDDLRDVTPLIEAKVTDEAMRRVFIALDPVLNRHLSMTKEDEEYVRYIVAAALGLDPA